MEATGRSDGAAPAASEAAAELRGAGLVRLVAAPDGDALAAAGVLARTLAADGTAFHVSVARRPPPGDRSTDADLTVTVGHPGGDLALVDDPVSAAAYDVADAVGEADPTLALAGVVAAGADPGQFDAPTAAADLDRRRGLALPVADPADGLAHSGLVHGPFSGDREAARTLLGDLGVDPDGGGHDGAVLEDGPTAERVASAVAVETVRDAPRRAAHAVERVLRPRAVESDFGTLGGLADVLDTTARTAPGTGVALALGHDAHEAGLAAWREHGLAVHRAVADAETARHDGVTIARVGDAPLGTVARLVRDFRSLEPIAVAAGEDAVAVAATEDVQEPLRAAADALTAPVAGRATRGRVADVDPAAFVRAFREAI